MKRDGKTILMTMLKSMGPGPRVWDEGMVMMYERGLRNIPESDCLMLADAINDTFKERPSSAEIQELWLNMKNAPKETYVEALVIVRGWIAKYGRHGRRGLMGRAGWMPNAMSEGPPAELDEATFALQSVINAYGGWISFVDQWTSGEPMTTKQSQFRDMYKAAASSASAAELKQLADAHKRMIPLIEQIEVE